MEQKNNTGAIFKNNHKNKDSHPDYKGTAMIRGQKTEISLWINESKTGIKYFGATFSEPYQAEVEAGYGDKKQEEKDDLPF